MPTTLTKHRYSFTVQTSGTSYYFSTDCTEKITGWNESDEMMEFNQLEWVEHLRALRYCQKKPTHRLF